MTVYRNKDCVTYRYDFYFHDFKQMKATGLHSIRLKRKLAWQQLSALKADIESFLDDGPYRPAVKFNKQTSRLTIQVEVHKPCDPMWGVRVGEIVHNFRSALDNVVWELAGCPSVRASKTQFPIFETESGFAKRGTKQFLKDVPARAVALIKAEQPFSARKDGTTEGTRLSPLWHLSSLWLNPLRSRRRWQ